MKYSILASIVAIFFMTNTAEALVTGSNMAQIQLVSSVNVYNARIFRTELVTDIDIERPAQKSEPIIQNQAKEKIDEKIDEKDKKSEFSYVDTAIGYAQTMIGYAQTMKSVYDSFVEELGNPGEYLKETGNKFSTASKLANEEISKIQAARVEKGVPNSWWRRAWDNVSVKSVKLGSVLVDVTTDVLKVITNIQDKKKEEEKKKKETAATTKPVDEKKVAATKPANEKKVAATKPANEKKVAATKPAKKKESTITAAQLTGKKKGATAAVKPAENKK